MTSRVERLLLRAVLVLLESEIAAWGTVPENPAPAEVQLRENLKAARNQIEAALNPGETSNGGIVAQAAQIIWDTIPGGASQRDIMRVIEAAIKQSQEMPPR